MSETNNNPVVTTTPPATLTNYRLSDPDRHNRILDEMQRMGGGFVSNLAKAWRYADAQNSEKLYGAFTTYYHNYEELAFGPLKTGQKR